ncbi:MAG: glycosyltransferase [Phycisphaerales bacterium]|nr:MAG: glycosyltransferase [Phycisphaerales bacterium]
MNPANHPVVVHVIHSLEGGGTERTLVALLRAFDPSVLRHVVVTLRGAGRLSARLPDHVACRPIAAVGRSWWTGPGLAKITRDYQAALIHARNTGCWIDAIIARILTPGARLVLGFHGLETTQPLSRRQRRQARWAVLAGARFVSVSQAGRRQLCDQAGVPSDRIDVLPNGVDLRRFGSLPSGTRKRMRANFGFDDLGFVVGTVGALTPVKQHWALIRAVAYAAKHVPNIRLLVVGEGPLLASLTEQASALSIANRVVFTGRREDVPALMRCMDAYVCSSASEGMSNALLEAMATGLPVVATDVGDNGLTVRDGIEGRIVEPGSPSAITDALTVLGQSPDLCQRFAASARTRAAEYDFDRTARAYEAYYRTLLVTPDKTTAGVISATMYPPAV